MTTLSNGQIQQPTHQVLGNLSESTSLLPEVDDDSNTTTLGALDGLLDTEDEVGTAGAL